MFQIPFSKGDLLYRASRDGFTPLAFHKKCDGKKNTLTIITSNAANGYVFGGFTSAKWESADRGTYAADSNAFIFSLRRDGVSNNEKFMISDPSKAIHNYRYRGPSFGENNFKGEDDAKTKYGDIVTLICISADHNSACDEAVSDFGSSYELPNGYKHGEDKTKSYLAGNYHDWDATEIEVFEMF